MSHALRCETCAFWVPMREHGICLCGDSPLWDAPYVRATETCEYWEPIEEAPE